MKFLSKKSTALIFVLILFLGLFFVNVKAAQANVFVDGLQALIKVVFSVIHYLTSFFTGLIAKLFTAILNLGFKDMRAVHLGWTISRDIVNMFFILGLIVIAFATILRIESYGMKALLAKFIIAALFINFSYLACGIIIDSSQVVTNYFIYLINGGQSETKADAGMGLLDALKVGSSLTPPTTTYPSETTFYEGDAEWTTILNLVFSAIIIGVAGLALLVGCLMLFIRMGTLWALMILVPFAWFFNVFPGLKQHFTKWWSEFIKWTFFAPIYVFFIYLILTIAKETEIFVLDASPMGAMPESLQNISFTGMMSNWNLLLHYILLVILLYGAVPLALNMGGKTASIGMGFAKGVLKGAYKLPGRLRSTMEAPPGWIKALIGEKASKGISNIAKFTNVKYWKEAYGERKKEIQREAGIGSAKGKMHDVLNRFLSIGKDKTRHADEAKQFEINEEAEKLTLETNRDSTQLVAALKTAIEEKKEKRAAAAIQLLYEQRDHNDMQMAFGDWKWTGKSEDAKETIDENGENLVGKEYGARTDSVAGKDLLFQMFEKMGVSEKKAAPFISNVNQLAFKNGVYSNYHFTKTDANGRVVRANDHEQKQVAATKLATQDMRSTTRNQHATTVVSQGWDKKNNRYTFEGWDSAFPEELKQMNMGQILQARIEEANPVLQQLVADGVMMSEAEYKKRGIKTLYEKIDAQKTWSDEEKAETKKKADAYMNNVKEFVLGQQARPKTQKTPKTSKTSKTPEAEGPSEAEEAEHRKKAGYE